MTSRFNFEALKEGLSKAVQTAATTTKKLGEAVAQEVVGAKCLLDYTLQGQVASGGPAGLWKIYLCRAKKEGAPYPLVSAWILDKRALTDEQQASRSGIARPSAKRAEQFLEQCRKDVQHLARLKHPSILRLVCPLEETRTQLVFLSEPLFASLEDLLHGGHGLPAEVKAERAGLKLSELESKHGLLQLCEGLQFLHFEAGMVHKAVCPENVYVTHSGAWRLAGFGNASPLDYSQPDMRSFDYSEPYLQITQPPLPYTAPELVAASAGTRVTSAADIFSLGALAYEALSHRQLLPVGNNLADFESRVASMAMHNLEGCPLGLDQILRQMVSPSPHARPAVAAFAGTQYFQGDTGLRALRFLDTMLQRDAMQKAAFLKDLPALCAQFDTRVLKLKVLPPLLGELRSEQLQAVLLPIVLRLMEVQTPLDFQDTTLPSLRPLLGGAKGDALFLLTQQAGLLARLSPKGPGPEGAGLVPALLVRAAEHGDVRCREEMLRQVCALADALDYESLKSKVLPAVHTLCLTTTSAGVRVAAFAAMERCVIRADEAEAEAMLGVATQVCTVDKSPATTMCVLTLGEAIAKQWGPRLTAEKVLPALCPLLVVPSLSGQQFGIAMRTLRDLLARIEKARGPSEGGGSPTYAGGQAGARQGGGKGTDSAGAPSSADWQAATSTLPTPSGRTPRALAAAGKAGPQTPAPVSPTANTTNPFLQPPDSPLGAQAQQQRREAQVPSPAWQQGGSGHCVSSSMVAQPRSPIAAGGSSGGPAAAATPAMPSLAGDPFAWPQPQHPTQPPGVAGQSMSKGAPMRAPAGGGGMGPASGGDPFAGLQLSQPQQQGGPGGGGTRGGTGTALGEVLDPFDSLVLSHAPQQAPQQQQQRKPQQNPWGDSLI